MLQRNSGIDLEVGYYNCLSTFSHTCPHSSCKIFPSSKSSLKFWAISIINRFKKSKTFRFDLSPSPGGNGKGIFAIYNFNHINIDAARPRMLSWYHKTAPSKEYTHQIQTKIIRTSGLESESQFTFPCTRLKVPDLVQNKL